MKKILAIVMALALVACVFAACGKKADEPAAQAKPFKAGVWAIMENGEQAGTYTFTDIMKECSVQKGEAGTPFDYEIDGDSYIFHIGSVDDNSPAKVVFTDDNNCIITWEDPAREETLTYVGAAEEQANVDIPMMIINSEPFVVTAKEGFENAGVTALVCGATEKYSFKASSEDVKWDIYVLDTPFEDGARYLIQANTPALSGDGELEIAEGKIIYVACSENAFTADAASDAFLSINYAEAAEDADVTATEAAQADIARMIINSEPCVITAAEGFENAGVSARICDTTEKYSFKASSEDVKWDIYVLDAPFTDGARYLIQANTPALSGDGELEIAEGKYIYIACSENAFTADAASDAFLEINYAE